MFIHGSLGTGAFSNSPALNGQFNVPPDPLGSTSPCSAHASDGPQPVRATQRSRIVTSSGIEILIQGDCSLNIFILKIHVLQGDILADHLLYLLCIGLSTFVLENSRLRALASKCLNTQGREQCSTSTKRYTWRSQGRSPFHTMGHRIPNKDEWIHTPGDVETEPSHFHPGSTATTVLPERTWRRNPIISPKMFTTQT